MRTKKIDYSEISRRSIKRDFSQVKNKPESNSERRVSFVCENSGYYKYKSFILGKLVRIIERAEIGWICEFVHDDDRKALNAYAGWSNNKKTYLLDGVRFK